MKRYAGTFEMKSGSKITVPMTNEQVDKIAKILFERGSLPEEVWSFDRPDGTGFYAVDWCEVAAIQVVEIEADQ